MPHIIEKIVFEYLEEQFKEVFILKSKYSSGLFTAIEGFFFWKNLSSIFFDLKIFFYLKNFFLI